MSVRFVSFSPDDSREPWTHWNQDFMGDWRANFYTPAAPYLRYPVTVTGCGPVGREVRKRLEQMKNDTDERMAARGYVTFDNLSLEAQKYWAEADATWLLNDIARHLASRSDATEDGSA